MKRIREEEEDGHVNRSYLLTYIFSTISVMHLSKNIIIRMTTTKTKNQLTVCVQHRSQISKLLHHIQHFSLRLIRILVLKSTNDNETKD